MKIAIATILALCTSYAQASDTPYEKVSKIFNKLPEAKVNQAVGKWKMVSYVHTRAQDRSQEGGLRVGGAGPHANELMKRMEISKTTQGVRFQLTNYDEQAFNSSTHNLPLEKNQELPRPEVSRRRNLHCKALAAPSKALLCKQRGISSASVYLACFAPMEEAALGACNLK